MTVYIGSVDFVAQLQRERDEALTENTKLRKLIEQIAQDTQDPNTQVTVVIQKKGKE